MNFTSLEDDFADMLTALTDNGVQFIVVGGFAMAFNGYSRATGDIDIFVKPDAENARRVISALRQFGAPLSDITESDFVKDGTIYQIGLPPLRIDIITAIDSLTFDQCANDSCSTTRNDIVIPYLSLENLIINKESTGRDKDRIDLSELRKLRNK